VSDYSCAEAGCSLEQQNKTSLRALILRKRQELLVELESSSADKVLVTTSAWAAAMQKVTGLMINWVELIPLLEIEDRAGLIDYKSFISELRANSSVLGGDDTGVLFNAMYAWTL
jgi:hypothetical protein